MSLSRHAPLCLIKLDGALLSEPQLLFAGRYAGARPLDFATIQMQDLTSEDGSRFENKELNSLFSNRRVEVSIGTRTGGSQPVHFGKVSAIETKIGPTGEVLILHSRLDDHLFGMQHFGQEIAIRGSTAREGHIDISGYLWETSAGVPLVFNPIFDGLSSPNMAPFQFAEPFRRFIDLNGVSPEGLNAARASTKETDANEVVWWSLSRAVEYICGTLNRDETYIRNPALAELRVTLDAEDVRVRDVAIPLGTYLPQALDLLLKPHGFSWETRLWDGARPQIRVFRNGAGFPIYQLLQPVGDALDTDKSNVKNLSLNFDAANGSFNHITVFGAPYELEASWILRPGWDEKYDDDTDYSYDAFTIGSDDWNADPARHQAWRRYVFNESGRYTGTRDLWQSAPSMGDVSPRFQNARRYKFSKTHTQDKLGSSLGRRQGVYLEFFDPTEDYGEWKTVDKDNLDNISFQLLSDEMGIWFSSSQPPSRFRAFKTEYGIEKCLLRITAVVKSNLPVWGHSRGGGLLEMGPPGMSFLNDERYETVDAGSSYAVRQTFDLDERDVAGEDVTSDSENKLLLSNQLVGGSVLTGEAFDGLTISTAVDDSITGTGRMKKRADALWAQFNRAVIEGSMSLDGIDWAYTHVLGSVVGGIGGKELLFNTSPPGLPERYPTVIGVEFNVQEQTSRIRLETLRNV